MGYSPAINEEKGNSFTLSHGFLNPALFRRKEPFNETFPIVSRVLLCHLWRGKENQRDRPLHTPTPRESDKSPELPLHFE
jgi:hypothetical protein